MPENRGDEDSAQHDRRHSDGEHDRGTDTQAEGSQSRDAWVDYDSRTGRENRRGGLRGRVMRSQFLRRFRGAGYLKIIGVILAVLGTVVITGTSGPLLSGAGTSDAGLSFVLRIILETTLLFTITAVLVAVFSLLVSGFTWLLSLRKNRSRTPATLIVIGVNFLVAAVILFHIPTLQPGPQFDIVSMLVASVGYLIPLFIAFFVTGQAKSKAKQSAKPK